MKTSRFSDSQIIAVLKQAEGGSPVPELCREHGISSATFYGKYHHLVEIQHTAFSRPSPSIGFYCLPNCH